jgi:peptidoglycan/xylan/chitin deacetylase (PgdA/CDA1 family)
MRAVLTYHSIDESQSPISISPDQFRAHHKWLTSGHVPVLPLEELLSQPTADDHAIAVTFDDGFLNVREAAASLAAEGVPVTLFVVSGQVGGTNAWGGVAQAGIPTLPLLSWDDLEVLLAKGVAIEAHTRTHPRLTGLSGDRLDAEMQGSADDLQGRLGVASTHLAYPYGVVDPVVAARAERFFRRGYTTEFDVVRPSDPPMWCPRLDMYYFREGRALEAWGSPGFRARLLSVRLRRGIRQGLGRFIRNDSER